MIEFHAPTPADKAWVDELLARGNYRGCDYNFTNLYVWSRAYNQRIARVDDFLVTHVCGRLGCSYMYPAGSGDIAAVIRALEADAAEKGEPLRLVCLTPRQMAELEEFFPGRFAYTADRDGYDYLYEVERLASMLALLPQTLTLPGGGTASGWYIYALATDPGARSKGYGRQLLRFVDGYLAERGADCVTTVPAEPSLF